MPDNDLQQLFARLASPSSLAQLVLIAVAALAGVMASHLARGWHARSPLRGSSSWHALVAEGAVLAAPSFTALVVLLIGRGLIELTDMTPALLDVALQLAVALLIVRLALYLLRLALGPNRWLHRWESRLTIILWLLLGFSLLGWFDFVESSLDAMDLVPGTARFTLWQLLKGIVVVTIFVVATSLVSRTIEARVMKLDGLAMSTRIGISKSSYVFLLALGMLVGINAAGVDLTALTVLTGAMGLGLGFGLQAVASNFVSGFVLLLDKSIKPGDVISFTGGTGTSTENFGWVQELRGRYVVVRDRDGVDTLVPNQNLITNTVINWSYSDPKVRLKLPVRVSYRDDVELALQVLLKAAQASGRVLKEPAPVSRLMYFGDSGIELELRFWIADPQEGVNNVRSDVNRAIWTHFKENGITIPVAQREIMMTYTAGGTEP
jgi:small-conductance mechanosensitive channel